MANISETTTKQTAKQQPVSETQQTTGNKIEGELKRIPVDDIEPNPSQPRIDFNEQELKELAETIKHHDLIQPISVSKLPTGKYRLIAGERRWRASKLANLKDIPAYIRQADETQLLELAILENLQRKNLLPMEQARAFRLLVEECKMNIKEIALRNGKTEYFVRQQIKLTDLIPQWQKILSKDGISIVIALQIAVIPEPTQKELYQEFVTKEQEKADKPVIQINQDTLKQYKGVLSETSFDISDTTLDTKMGACTICPFNSACNSLFPNESKNPRCNNIACFNNKTAIHLNREFNKAKNDPTVLLVYEAGYSVPEYLKKLKGEGIEILRLGYSDDCKELKEPQKPDWKEFEKWAKRQNQTDKEIKASFKKEEENYDFKKEVFDKNVASGKYKRAFVVDDAYNRQTGKYIYVEINIKKPTAKDAQKAITEGNASVHDVTNEINRLQEKEDRAKELDAEKVQEKIVQALNDCKAFQELPKASNRIDNTLINFLLLESLSYSSRATIEKILKLPAYKSDSKSQNQFYKSLESLSKQQVSFLIHQIIIDKYGNNLPITKEGFIVRKMAEALGLVPIATFEKEQKEKAAKRQERLKERINELNKHKQQLASSSKKLPATKATEIESKTAA